MTTYRVAVISGDGIGNEVTPAAVQALDACAAAAGFRFEWTSFPWGSAWSFEHGRMMPDDALDQLRPFDAIFFGAVGDPKIQDNVTLNGLLLPIRRTFDQYACVRPAVLYPGVRCPLAGKQPGDIDFVVVRENTEGEYAQVGGVLYSGGAHEVAVQSSMFTRHGTERVMRFAFDLARRRSRKRLLTSVTKSNAQGFSMAFWDRVFADVARDFRTPHRIAARRRRLHGSRQAAGDLRRHRRLEPVRRHPDRSERRDHRQPRPRPERQPQPRSHVPVDVRAGARLGADIAGKGVANPMAAMLAGGMMLEFLGQPEAARSLEGAVIGVLAEGKSSREIRRRSGHRRSDGGGAGAPSMTFLAVRSGVRRFRNPGRVPDLRGSIIAGFRTSDSDGPKRTYSPRKQLT